MKITGDIVAKLADAIRSDLAHVADECPERLVKHLDEQVRSGGDNSITLGIAVEVTDQGLSENTIRVRTRYGWTRKVKVSDELMDNFVDLGDTLFDHATKVKGRKGKEAASGEGGEE
jgi:hypothetical protein